MNIPTQIELSTLYTWINSNDTDLTIESVGEENIYFTDEFGQEFYCKCLQGGVMDINVSYIGAFKEVKIYDDSGDLRYSTEMLSENSAKELGLDLLKAAMDLIEGGS